tara:strand:- start:3025 stop:3954 length:930 start_codon:yes stop_codon:yes gene_type:complete
MEKRIFTKLLACLPVILAGGCSWFARENIGAGLELPLNDAPQVSIVVPKLAHSGGLAFDSEGILYFANHLNPGTIGRYAVDQLEPATVFIDLNEWLTTYGDQAPIVQGLTIDAEGRLIGAVLGTGKIIRVSPDASKVEVLADSHEGILFSSVHDVVLAPEGLVYASSPDEGVIYRISPDEGKVQIVNQELVRADGLAISPDGKCLVVAEPDAARVLVFSLENEYPENAPVSTLDFSGSGQSPRGLLFDKQGRLFVGMGEAGTVNVFDLTETRLLRTYEVGGSADRLFLREGELWISGGRDGGVRKLTLK